MKGASGFAPDFVDMLRALAETGAEFLVVGAHAMAVHGVPRATGDLDVLVRPSADNAVRVLAALRSFGAPVDSHGVSEADLATPDTVYQIGLPPNRIDLMTSISGLDFDEAWRSRELVEVEGIPIPFLGRDALVKNKRATGRAKDELDLALLGER